MSKNERVIIADLSCYSIENSPGEHVYGMAAIITIWLQLIAHPRHHEV